jgi:hypothetical protein
MQAASDTGSAYSGVGVMMQAWAQWSIAPAPGQAHLVQPATAGLPRNDGMTNCSTLTGLPELSHLLP